MLIGVISDTHLRGEDVPAEILEALKGVELILHAGDILEMSILRKFEEVAETIAVKGNMDRHDATESLPDRRVITAGGFKIGITHGWGPPMGIKRRARAMFKENLDCVIYGHTHTAEIKEKDGILYFNPGSPTDKMFADRNTIGFLEVTDKLVPSLTELRGR